jgi:hypothetical protein
MVMINANSFDGMKELVFKNSPRAKEIEKWLEHEPVSTDRLSELKTLQLSTSAKNRQLEVPK